MSKLDEYIELETLYNMIPDPKFNMDSLRRKLDDLSFKGVVIKKRRTINKENLLCSPNQAHYPEWHKNEFPSGQYL